MDLRSPPNALATRRPWVDIDAVAACAPLIVVLAVGTLRKGGFFKPDVVVLPCLCLALAAASPAIWRWLRDHPLPALAGLGVTAWWLTEAAVVGHGVESWRLAATWVCAAAGYGIARALPLPARKISALAITMIGVALSLAGVAVVAARSGVWTWPDERSLRFQGPLTYPSAIGLYLVITLLASLTVGRRACPPDAGTRPDAPSAVPPSWTAAPARTLIMLGVVSTDSRGALAALVVALCFRRVRRESWPALIGAALASPLLLYGQRDGVRPELIAAAVVIGVAAATGAALAASRPAGRRSPVSTRANVYRTMPRAAAALIGVVLATALAAAGWLLATQHHAVSGFDASWTERWHILRGAYHLFWTHPWFGAGPDPSIPTTTLSGAPGIDAFAHNEPVEVLLSVGAVGAVALAVAALVGVRALWARRGLIAAPLLAAIVAGGLVDFVWHFPALGLLAGVVAGISTAPRPAASPASGLRV